ncbi:hypothetical protein BY996DRAFT_4593891 [Phakopsora pachyrhizi]|uniref:Phosphodiesterase n=1 Tax=Phakopsora pachyrhizi TaxID=170000 RepID=A0AAV0AQU8_PHAPC|nr:hypothetical protein BY996DRAFT_4593891 [Phakopsora pachyrhizi]CAH7671616.1 hypothetical protein PPACK8108_LOCUS6409 [Phakopsora pachyrhizi]
MTVLSPYLTAPTTQPSPSSTSSTPTAMTPTPSSITQINSSSPSSPPFLPLVKIDACLVSGAERLTIPSSKTLSPFNRPPPLRPLRRMSSTGTKIELQPNTNPLERRLDLFGLHTSSLEGPLNDLVIGGECGLENRGEALGAQTTPNENWIAHHLSAVLQHSFTVSSPHPITSSPSAYSSTTNHNSSCPARRVLETLHNKLSLTSLSSFTASNTTTDDDEEEDEEADEACSQVSVGSICSYLKSSDSESLNFIGRSPVSFPSNFVPSSLPRSILHQMTSQPHSSTSRPVLLRVLNTWSFDANNLSPLQIRCSLHILLSVFIKYNHEFSQKLESMGVIRLEACLANLVRNLEAAYDPRNAYHNFRHAVDVVQAVYTILSHEGVVPSLDWVIRKETEGDESMNWHRQPIGRLGHALDDMTIWALLLAAAGHDVGHPGLSNAFMVNARTPIAYVFSDGAVLENFHRITFTRMLREHGFQKLVDGSIGFRRVLAGCVLATDMGRHFPIVEELKQLHCSWEALSAEQKITEEQVLSEKVLIAAGIIKCGDISNSSRPHPISLTWSSCLLSEWSRQAALEAELSLPISVVTLDRTEKKAQAKSQVGFTSLFALPLFTVMEQLSPGCKLINQFILR